MSFNGAQIHLLLNHISVVGIPIVLAFLAASLWTKSEKILRFSLAMLVVIAAVVLPTYFTGEGAEEVVESVSGISEASIEAHEEAAGVALALTLALGVAALVALVGRTKTWGKLALGIVFMLGLVAVVSLSYVGHLGGLVRHTELQSSPAIDSD